MKASRAILPAAAGLLLGTCSIPQSAAARPLIRGRIISDGTKQLPVILLPDGRQLCIMPPKTYRVGEDVALRAHIAVVKPQKVSPCAQVFGIHVTGGEYVHLDP